MFRVDAEAAHLALQLRQKWHSLFLRRMRAPARPWSQVNITYMDPNFCILYQKFIYLEKYKSLMGLTSIDIFYLLMFT